MRAADDFAVIRARVEELERERRGGREPERPTARADTRIGAAAPKSVEEMKARIIERNRLWMERR